MGAGSEEDRVMGSTGLGMGYSRTASRVPEPQTQTHTGWTQAMALGMDQPPAHG